MAEKRNYQKKPTTPLPIPANEFGKLPPQALELEEAVLGAIMIEKDAYSIIADIFLIFVDNFHLAIEPIRLQRLKLETRRLISIMAL